MAIINVINMGAVGNGTTNDTLFINKAISLAKKGDTVYLPCGKYLVGTIKLKSDIIFEMSSDSVLIGSSDLSDYEEFLFDRNNRYNFGNSAYSPFPKCSLVYLDKIENVEIIGGNILFDDLSFDDKQDNNPVIEDDDYISGVGYFRKPKYSYPPNKSRPVGLYISGCKNIKIEKLYFEKCPVYSAWILNSCDLLFDGVKIRNSKYQWNGDGLHFSACKNVEVKNCDIFASDDCIAVDGEYGGKSDNIFVHDCVFESTIHIIRLYTGLDFGSEKSCGDDFEKYSISNIRISDCKVLNGVCLLLVCAFNGNIRDVGMKNLEFRQEYEGTAISVNAKCGTVSDFTIENCDIKANGIGYFCQSGEGKIKDFKIKNTVFLITPKTKLWGVDYKEGLATHAYSMPYNLVCKNISSLIMEKVKISWNKSLFSDSFSALDRKKMEDAIGVQELKALEPKKIKAINNINSNIIISGCEIEDYKME